MIRPTHSHTQLNGQAMIHHTHNVLPVLIFSVICGKLGLAEDWRQFRGPNNGHCLEAQVPTQWGDLFHEPVWKTFIPGKGWSSPIVVGDKIWLTSAEEVAIDAGKAADKLAKLTFSSQDIVVDASVALFALELDADTGSILRRIDLFTHVDPSPIHATNSYASPTPVSDGERVFCYFGALGIACVNMKAGTVVWKRELPVDELTGSGASPVLWGDRLILACDGSDQQYITALDKLTGETQFKVNRPTISVVDDSHRRAFSTPLIVESDGRCQLLSLAAQWLISYNPSDGSEWWRAKIGAGYSLVPTPVFDRNRVFVCTGYNSPEMVAVDTQGTGDVTDTAILWRYRRQVPEISSPIVVDDNIYFVSSSGIFSCVATDSGALVWQHRLKGKFAASLTYSAGRIYVTSNGGVTTVIRPGREYVELATNELFGETNASLSVYKQSFVVRTNPFLFRLGDN